jgi:hypothetical protein
VTQFQIGKGPAVPRLVPFGPLNGLIDDVDGEAVERAALRKTAGSELLAVRVERDADGVALDGD